MIVRDEAYLIPRRILFIQHLQKPDEIRAFVGRTYKGNRFAGKQVDGCKQRQHTRPHIFIIPVYRAVFICTRNRRPVVSSCIQRLHPGLLITGKGMDRHPFKRTQIPILVKLQGKLFVNNQDIMHFGIEIRVAPFAVV